MKIIDCFTFYNELDLLNYRFHILNPYVDYFVLVEAHQTQVGRRKPLYYEENKQRFTKFHHKIIHIIVNLPFPFETINFGKKEQWQNENFQRNSIQLGLSKIDLDPNDILIIADLDEIVNPAILQQVKQATLNPTDHYLIMDNYTYNLNTRHDTWIRTKILSYQSFKQRYNSCEQVRQGQKSPGINNGGWHLSYFGDPAFIKNKLEQCAHVEHNIGWNTNIKTITDNIRFQRELTDKSAYKTIPMAENTNLPVEYEKYLSKYIVTSVGESSAVSGRFRIFLYRRFYALRKHYIERDWFYLVKHVLIGILIYLIIRVPVSDLF